MIFELPFEHMEPAAAYFSRRPCHHTFRLIQTGVKLEFDETKLSPEEYLRLIRHLKYLNAFRWEGVEPAEFVFGERLEAFPDFLRDFQNVTGELSYDLLVAVEPGGIVPVELLSTQLNCPMLRVQPTDSALEIDSEGRSVLIVDDLIRSGAALESAARALRQAGYAVSGAFVLLDMLPIRRRAAFDFPICALMNPA